MSPPGKTPRKPHGAPFLAAAGLLVVGLAWMIPAHLSTLSPAVLAEAGRGTPTVAGVGRDLADLEETGPAALVLEAAQAAGDPRAPALERAVRLSAARHPDKAAWGGSIPALVGAADARGPVPEEGGLGPLAGAAGPAAPVRGGHPVLDFLLQDDLRDAVRRRLEATGSEGVLSLLRLRDVPATGRFVPARAAGGQPLDAVIVLAALLYQEERMAPDLRRELRARTDDAVARGSLGDLEGFALDLLSLGRRLDWTQLGELLRRTGDGRTVAEYAHLFRVAPEAVPDLYAAALMADSADEVAGYLIAFGRPGAADLHLALSRGQGAVRLLVGDRLPVDRTGGPSLGAVSSLVIEAPGAMLGLKLLVCGLGFLGLIRGLDAWVVGPGPLGQGRGWARGGLLAGALCGLFLIATEPELLRASSVSEYSLSLRLPVLSALSASPVPPSPPNPRLASMQPSTLLSILIFAALQVGVYLICLRKIGEIDRQDIPPALKLRLMENEENLFDCGLYVGMMGTAAALVLQVVGVIEANLLAAYSSNLFGIVCVALVKIRHVRGSKRRLILEIQAQGSP